jgi:hypothetical protein
VGVEPDGEVRPGAWTYGQPTVGPSAYGAPAPPPAPPAPAALLGLRRAYLATLP